MTSSRAQRTGLRMVLYVGIVEECDVVTGPLHTTGEAGWKERQGSCF